MFWQAQGQPFPDILVQSRMTWILIGSIIGAVLGLIPLFYGLRKNLKLALGGFVACIVGGSILGIFASIPLAVIFVFLISKNAQNNSSQPKNDLRENLSNTSKTSSERFSDAEYKENFTPKRPE